MDDEFVFLLSAVSPLQNATHITLKETAIRVGCVAFFVGIAYLVPNINDLATLVGGMMSPMLGFIFPPLFNLRLYKGRLPLWNVVVNYFLIVFGLFSGVYTTVRQLQKMV